MRSLFIDLTGRLVETSDPDSEIVEFCNQGGGFLYRMRNAVFHDVFKPSELPGFKLSAVTADWWDDYEGYGPIPAYLDGARWNGWAIPYFTLENALEVARRNPEVLRWDEENRCFRVDEYGGGDYAVGSETITVDGVEVEVYQLVDGWCWDEA